MSAVCVEKAFHDLLCAPVCRRRCIGYALFLAWGVFWPHAQFSRLHLKYFLECLPFQPPWKQLAFCWSFMGKQSPVEYFCDSFYLPGLPGSNADESLLHPTPSFRLFNCYLTLLYYKMLIILQYSKNVCKMYRRKTMCFIQTTSPVPIEPNCSAHTES